MSSTESKPLPLERSSGKELASIAASLLLLLAAQLAAFKSFSLFRRHFWFDEILTSVLVTDGDFGHACRALAGGFETHPPALYLLLRVFTYPFGGPSEVSLRAFAFFSIFTGLIGVYALLRQSYSLLVSFVAVLLIWCHPLVHEHAFEARCYAPWFAATIWLSYLLVRVRESRGVWLKAALALASVLICTLHYFGVLSLILVVGWEYAFRRPLEVGRWNGFVAACLGVPVLLACVPLLLAQRTAYTVPTWVDPPSAAMSLLFVRLLILPEFLLFVILPLWLTQMARSRGKNADKDGQLEDLTRFAGLTGLLFLPVVLILVAYLVQPVLVPRYALPAVAGLAPVSAYLLSRCSRSWVLLLGLLFVFVSATGLGTQARKMRQTDEQTEQLANSIRQHCGDQIVVFQSASDLFVVYRYAPDLRTRCLLLDFEVGEIKNVRTRNIFLRDDARNYIRNYGHPLERNVASLRDLTSFFFVPATEPTWAITAADAFPDHTARPVSRGIWVLSSSPGTRKH